MFSRLRRALDDALTKLEERTIPEADVDRLLAGMREELVGTKARIPELQVLLRTQERQRAEEDRKARDCVRRAGQAQAIGDSETVEVANRFAKRHLARVEVLDRKLEGTRADLVFQEAQVVEMTAQLKEALSRRDALAVQARRARAVQKLRGGEFEAVEEFERVADRAERDSELDSVRRELDAEPGRGSDRPAPDPGLDRMEREAGAEELLRELKRQMGLEPEEPR
ncbi:MAG: PspA/IM30 family protein [Gemmatimonadota bacterium]